MGLLEFFWMMLWFFLWIVWIMLLFRVFADIFRSDMSGIAKAVWIVFVIFLPFLGVLVYLISQGDDMTKRQIEQAANYQQAQADYIQGVAGGGGTASEIEKLAELRDKGVLTADEFEAQKAKALA